MELLTAYRKELEKIQIRNGFTDEQMESYRVGFIDGCREQRRADAQEVKHGHWISSGRDNDYNSYCRCSRCDHEIVMYRDSEKKPPNYCDNCGADMRGE